MAARAIWKGELQIGKHPVGVKLYSAIEDRSIHFRLLHEKDRAPVEQHIVGRRFGCTARGIVIHRWTSMTSSAANSSRNRLRARCRRASIALWLAPRCRAIS